MQIVLITALQILFFSLFKTKGLEDVVGIAFVFSNALLILWWSIVSKETRAFAVWILVALVIREFLLFSDYFHFFSVPHSGSDSEVFAGIAERNFMSGSYVMERTNYTHFLTTIYFIVGPVRMIAQQLNVAFGIGTILVSLIIFDEIGLSARQKKIGVILLSVFPHFCIFSAILLREASIQFCIAYSTLFFIRWMKTGSFAQIAFSFLPLALGSLLHGGCALWGLGYLLAFCFYRPHLQKNAISFVTGGSSILFAVAVILLVPLMNSRAEATATMLSEGEFVVDGAAAADAAGSAYLTWLNISNPYLLLLFSPLKMFYFLFSPIPLDWRGVMDVVAFCLDSTFYIWAFFKIIQRFRDISDPVLKNITRYLMASILAMTFVFAYGTIASGTALRHRCKFFPEIALVALICLRTEPRGTKRRLQCFTLPVFTENRQ